MIRKERLYGERGLEFVPLCPGESRPSGGCREKAARHQAGPRSTGGWGRSGLRQERHLSLFCDMDALEKNVLNKTFKLLFIDLDQTAIN